MLEATVKFFKIKKCGFFLRGHDLPCFGGIGNTLNSLSAWARDGRSIINTTCYQSDSASDIHDTFFVDGHGLQDHDDCILVLWNETPNDDGVIYGMLPAQAPGMNAMIATRFDNPAAIPGQPSYFWFVPSANVFASIRFAHSSQGKTNLERYLHGFLVNKSPNRVLDQDGSVVGYSQNSQPTQDSARIYPAFHAVGHKTTELETELLTNLHRIRKFVKRECLSYTVTEERSVIERVLSGLLPNPPVQVQSRSITHEMQFQPTELQLLEILQNFSNLDNASTIQNAGFVYEDGKRVMLNGAYSSTRLELNVQRDNNQIVSPQLLLTALRQHRQDLLRPLRNVNVELRRPDEVL